MVFPEDTQNQDTTEPITSAQDVFAAGYDKFLSRPLTQDAPVVPKGQISHGIFTVLDASNILTDILPSSDNIFHVGSATKRWTAAYLTTLYLGTGIQVTSSAAELNKLTGTSANVTPANLNILTGAGNADSLHIHDASKITFTPSTPANWTGGVDPGNTNDGLDQLASRTKAIETSGVAPSGAAGGDLSGTYPNPSVVDDSHNHTVSTITNIASNYLKLDASNSPITGILSVKGGSSSSNAKVGGTIFDHYVDAGNGTTVETDLYSDSILASTLGTNGDKLECEYGGVFVSSGTATREVRLYFAGTSIFDTGALTLSLSSAWTLFATIIRVSATVVRYMISFTTEGAALSAYTAVGELTGLTLSNANILKITGQAAGIGAATNDIVAKLGSVIWQPAA